MEFFPFVYAVAYWLYEKVRERNITPLVRHSSVRSLLHDYHSSAPKPRVRKSVLLGMS